MNISDFPKTIEMINNIINNNKIAEVKIEREKDLVVVEVSRTVRNSEKTNG